MTSLCRVCFEICDKSSFPIVGELKKILESCIVEIDLRLDRNSVICPACKNDLIQANEFKRKCLITQKKILIFRNQFVLPVAPDNSMQFSSGQKDDSFLQKPLFKSELMDDDSINFFNNFGGNNSGNLANFDQFNSKEFDLITSSPLELSCDQNLKDDAKLGNETVPMKTQEVENKNTENKESMTNSKSPKTTMKMYKCEKCAFMTKTKTALSMHKTTCSKKASMKENPPLFVCHICEKPYGTRDGFSNHMQRVHNLIVKMHSCHLCNFNTINMQTLKDHVETAHQIIKNNQKDAQEQKGNRVPLLSCTVDACTRKFMSKKGLMYHVNSHHLKKVPESEKQQNSDQGTQDKQEDQNQEGDIKNKPSKHCENGDPVETIVLDEEDNQNTTSPVLSKSNKRSFSPDDPLVSEITKQLTKKSDIEYFLVPESVSGNPRSNEQSAEEGKVDDHIGAKDGGESDEATQTKKWNWDPECGKVLYNIGKARPGTNLWNLPG